MLADTVNIGRRHEQCTLDILMPLRRASMKVRAVYTVCLSLALLSGICIAAAHEYQAGKIVRVEKQESQASSGGTDAPMKAQASTYRISILLGDKVYVCRYQTDSDNDISWVESKDIQARVSGKAMYVKKVNGKEAKGSILSTAPAGKP
jgi:hypothetical protein